MVEVQNTEIKIKLCGAFLSVGDILLFDIASIIKISKFNYVPDRKYKIKAATDNTAPDYDQFCISILQDEVLTDVVAFIYEEHRDLAFRDIQRCLTQYHHI